jgi:hypothetical protein
VLPGSARAYKLSVDLYSARHTATWRRSLSPSCWLVIMVIVDAKWVARTERLRLRPLTLDDAEDVVLMRKDPEVMKHT